LWLPEDCLSLGRPSPHSGCTSRLSQGEAKVVACSEIRRLGNRDRSFRISRNHSASRLGCGRGGGCQKPAPRPCGFERKRPARRPLSAHLPREGVGDAASAARPCSGGSALRKIGEDVTEMVDHVPASWKSLPPRGRWRWQIAHMSCQSDCKFCTPMVGLKSRRFTFVTLDRLMRLSAPCDGHR
jgi:hypothetical protein